MHRLIRHHLLSTARRITVAQEHMLDQYIKNTIIYLTLFLIHRTNHRQHHHILLNPTRYVHVSVPSL